MQTVGEMIRELRHDRGLTLAEVAEAIGSTKSYLSMIENHRVARPPSVRVLEQLEEVLGVTDGRLHKAGDWERAPQGVRERFQKLTGDVARGRELARFIQESAAVRSGGGRNLDELYLSGEPLRIPG